MLVDKQIKQRAPEIFPSGYEEENIGCISYDLTIGKILAKHHEDRLELQPGDFVMIESREEFTVPRDLALTVGEKNSLMRTGLSVDGPVYFPGHHSRAYLRVLNASGTPIVLDTGMKIAQLFFHTLDELPEQDYQSRPVSSFADETAYRGYGKYDSVYTEKIGKLEEATEGLRNQEGKIYANILTLMGIFVSIFSILTIDFTVISQNISIRNLVLVNCSLGLLLLLFMALVMLVVGSVGSRREQSKKYWWIFLVAAALLAGILLIFLFR